jgi:hypothetical protein
MRSFDMKRHALLSILLVPLMAYLSSCVGSQSDAIDIRVAALRYAFEHDSDSKTNLANWIFSVDSDIERELVVAGLSNYPIARGKLEIEDRNEITRFDKNTGKRSAYWRVKIEKKQTGEVWAYVDCVKGGLNGYGQILLMRKTAGRWVVVSSTPTWIS